MPPEPELQRAYSINTVREAHEWARTAIYDADTLLGLARGEDFERFAVEDIERVFLRHLVAHSGASKGIGELRRLCPTPGVGPHYDICKLCWLDLVVELVDRICSCVGWVAGDVDGEDPAAGGNFWLTRDTPYLHRPLIVGDPAPSGIKSDPLRYLEPIRRALCEIPRGANDYDIVRTKLLAELLDVQRAAKAPAGGNERISVEPKIDKKTQAIAALLIIGPNASKIAESVGVPRGTLLGWPEFRQRYDQVKADAKNRKSRYPRGYKSEGRVEAWQNGGADDDESVE